jgi:hypothetical protein
MSRQQGELGGSDGRARARAMYNKIGAPSTAHRGARRSWLRPARSRLASQQPLPPQTAAGGYVAGGRGGDLGMRLATRCLVGMFQSKAPQRLRLLEAASTIEDRAAIGGVRRKA